MGEKDAAKSMIQTYICTVRRYNWKMTEDTEDSDFTLTLVALSNSCFALTLYTLYTLYTSLQPNPIVVQKL